MIFTGKQNIFNWTSLQLKQFLQIIKLGRQSHSHSWLICLEYPALKAETPAITCFIYLLAWVKAIHLCVVNFNCSWDIPDMIQKFHADYAQRSVSDWKKSDWLLLMCENQNWIQSTLSLSKTDTIGNGPNCLS